MGEARRRDEHARQRLELVDSVTPSPYKRFESVFNLLKDNEKLTNYDIVCFSILFLYSQVELFPWLKDIVKNLFKLLLQFHYWYGYKAELYPENINTDTIT